MLLFLVKFDAGFRRFLLKVYSKFRDINFICQSDFTDLKSKRRFRPKEGTVFCDGGFKNHMIFNQKEDSFLCPLAQWNQQINEYQC
jgi:hypothetical protein